jgi:hypothetical protein
MITDQTCILAIHDEQTGTDVGLALQLGYAMSTINVNCKKPLNNLQKLL